MTRSALEPLGSARRRPSDGRAVVAAVWPGGQISIAAALVLRYPSLEVSTQEGVPMIDDEAKNEAEIALTFEIAERQLQEAFGRFVADTVVALGDDDRAYSLAISVWIWALGRLRRHLIRVIRLILSGRIRLKESEVDSKRLDELIALARLGESRMP